MEKPEIITIWDGCNPLVAEAITQFQQQWRPYSKFSKRYPIVRLIQGNIDPAVAAYAAVIPKDYLNFIPGVARGLNFSETIRLVKFEGVLKSQRQLLRAFVITVDGYSARDREFIATLESLIELVWACTRKRPAKKLIKDRRQNSQRVRNFCRFCGNLAELTLLARGDETPKLKDPEDMLYLSSQFCMHHRPKSPDDIWNPAYRSALRSEKKFTVELNRLIRQSATRKLGTAKAGDDLVDKYFFYFMLDKTLQPADKAELRNLARQMVDSKLSDRKKQMLTLRKDGFNQSEIAGRLSANQKALSRQAVSKALASVPEKFCLKMGKPVR